jgi:hypothetical protein
MRAESDLQPGVSFEINELPGGTAEILFYENVQEIPDGEAQRFRYDQYIMTTPNRENLEADIENNYEQWIARARLAEAGAEPPPSAEDRIAALERENEVLKGQNAELSSLVNIMLGGEEGE